MGCPEGRGEKDDRGHCSGGDSSRSRDHASGRDLELPLSGVAPLMARRLSLFKMTAEALSDGSRLSASLPSDAEIARWLTEAMEVRKDATAVVVPYVFPIPGCPPMRPELALWNL